MAFDYGAAGNNIGTGISDFGTAYGDFQAAQGSKAAAKSFGEAAQLEDENAILAKTSGAIEQAQLTRQLYQSGSATEAGAAGAGLKMSGSAQDVMRQTAFQGGIASARLGAQTEINIKGYEAQAGAYRSQQLQEQKLAKSQTNSGWMSALAGVASIAMIAA